MDCQRSCGHGRGYFERLVGGRAGSWWWQAAGAGECFVAINSSSEHVLQVVAVDALIRVSMLKATAATGGVNAKLYCLDSAGPEVLSWPATPAQHLSYWP